jgi:hypothetical protein
MFHQNYVGHHTYVTNAATCQQHSTGPGESETPIDGPCLYASQVRDSGHVLMAVAGRRLWTNFTKRPPPSQPLFSLVIQSHTLEPRPDIDLIWTSRYDETTDWRRQFSHVSALPESSLHWNDLRQCYIQAFANMGLPPLSPDVLSTRWSTGTILPSF